MSIGNQKLDVVPGGIVARDLNELTTSPPRLGATIRETREGLLRVYERSFQELAEWVSGDRIPQQRLKPPCTISRCSDPPRRPG